MSSKQQHYRVPDLVIINNQPVIIQKEEQKKSELCDGFARARRFRMFPLISQQQQFSKLEATLVYVVVDVGFVIRWKKAGSAKITAEKGKELRGGKS